MVSHTLLIDDSDIDLFIQRRFLEVFNFSKEFTLFKSADEALDWLTHQPDEAIPEVIFLDLNMPKTDGFAFLERFAQLPPAKTQRPRIVILTSSNSAADAKRTRAFANVIHFITKPMKQSDIEKLLENLKQAEN
ncbi:MAG: response regulator [Cyclobacteriaceae bacterium]|nr:MAG: response regulator [Cyclobacteriaceae bacterium]